MGGISVEGGASSVVPGGSKGTGNTSGSVSVEYIFTSRVPAAASITRRTAIWKRWITVSLVEGERKDCQAERIQAAFGSGDLGRE